VKTIETLVSSSSFNNSRDRWQAFEVNVIFVFLQKTHLNTRGQELITCSQILNRRHTWTMCSDKTLNYDCSKLSN